MRRALAVLLMLVGAGFAADQWTKVKELKSGDELKVYKKGERQPVMAKYDEATDEKLIVATKDAQVAIAKEDIVRIDYREGKPRQKARVTSETKDTTPVPGTATPKDRVYGSGVGPSTSSSTSVAFGSKGEFKTIYKR